MFIALVSASVLLAAICVFSAVGKLSKQDQPVAIIHGVVGVPLRFFPVLAALSTGTRSRPS